MRHFRIRDFASVWHTLKQLRYMLADRLEVFSRRWQWILNTFGKWKNWWSAFLYGCPLLTNVYQCNCKCCIQLYMRFLILLNMFWEYVQKCTFPLYICPSFLCCLFDCCLFHYDCVCLLSVIFPLLIFGLIISR